jgi:hypothetical protein
LIFEEAPDVNNYEEQSNNSVAEESLNDEEIIRKTAKNSQIKAPKTKKKLQIEDDDEDEEIVAKETNKRKYTKNTNKLVPKPSIRPIKVLEKPEKDHLHEVEILEYEDEENEQILESRKLIFKSPKS